MESHALQGIQDDMWQQRWRWEEAGSMGPKQFMIKHDWVFRSGHMMSAQDPLVDSIRDTGRLDAWLSDLWNDWSRETPSPPEPCGFML